MSKYSNRNAHRTFSFVPFKRSHLYWVARWIGVKNDGNESYRARMQEVFNEHFRDIWESPLASTWMMTVNGQPLFCLTLVRPPLRAGEREEQAESGASQLYLLPSPFVRRSERRLMLAWQAASIHAFMKVGVGVVQVAVVAAEVRENELLLGMGYRLVRGSSETNEFTGAGGVLGMNEFPETNMYICNREDFRPVL